MSILSISNDIFSTIEFNYNGKTRDEYNDEQYNDALMKRAKHSKNKMNNDDDVELGIEQTSWLQSVDDKCGYLSYRLSELDEALGL